MPAEARHPDAVESINVVAGRVTKVPLIAGEQVLASKLALEREDAGLALIIPAGNRAISVEVSEVSGTGGLILPGDRVDVIGVRTTRIDSTEEEPVGTSSDVITDTNVIVRAVTPLQNVTVMAVAQALRSETRSADDEESDGSQRRDIAESATLSVSPVQAQRLALYSELCTLRLALRPAADEAIVEIDYEELYYDIAGLEPAGF